MTSPITKGAEPMSKSEGVDAYASDWLEVGIQFWETKRPISHIEARDCAKRLVNSHFRNPDTARVSIPANPDHDDDLIVHSYIRQQARAAALAATPDPAVSSGSSAPFKCAGRNSVGANDPGDCGWPVCGCDPHADKVIAALQESGRLLSPTAEVAGEVVVPTGALADIAAERRRQVEAEGWTPEHDDEHDKCEMAKAAACYALAPSPVGIEREWVYPNTPKDWPWDRSWWKPGFYRRNLVKAGALIVAEIERWDRLNLAAAPVPPEPARPVSGEVVGLLVDALAALNDCAGDNETGGNFQQQRARQAYAKITDSIGNLPSDQRDAIDAAFIKATIERPDEEVLARFSAPPTAGMMRFCPKCGVERGSPVGGCYQQGCPPFLPAARPAAERPDGSAAYSAYSASVEQHEGGSDQQPIMLQWKDVHPSTKRHWLAVDAALRAPSPLSPEETGRAGEALAQRGWAPLSEQIEAAAKAGWEHQRDGIDPELPPETWESTAESTRNMWRLLAEAMLQGKTASTPQGMSLAAPSPHTAETETGNG